MDHPQKNILISQSVLNGPMVKLLVCHPVYFGNSPLSEDAPPVTADLGDADIQGNLLMRQMFCRRERTSSA